MAHGTIFDDSSYAAYSTVIPLLRLQLLALLHRRAGCSILVSLFELYFLPTYSYRCLAVCLCLPMSFAFYDCSSQPRFPLKNIKCLASSKAPAIYLDKLRDHNRLPSM